MSNQSDLHIRDARYDEREGIQEVTLAAYAEYAALVPPPFWEAYRQQLLTTLAAKESVERIVAEVEERIVGSVLLFAPAASAYGRANVRVAAPEARGKGVATGLMNVCRQRARAQGARALGLHTMDFMRAAVRLYERLGFVRAPEVDFSPVEGVLVKGYRLSLDDGPEE